MISTIQRLRSSGALVFLVLVPWCSAGAEETRREHEAHEHGAAEVHVVVEGEALYVELRVPAMNVVGFEHAAHDEAQRRTIAAVAEQLERTEEIFTPTPAAQCRSVHAHASLEMIGHAGEEHEHEQGSEKEHEESESVAAHSEMQAEYEFECASPDELAEIRTQLFEHYPGIERIDAEIIGSGGQTAATLTSQSPLVPIPR